MVKPLATALALLLIGPASAAEPIEFTTTGPAVNIARSLMSTERGEPLRDDEIVSVGLVDLDGDGTRDIFAFADASYFCGSAGCVPRLYRLERSTGKWSELPLESDTFINGEPAMWSTGPVANGWLTLILAHPDFTLSFVWAGEGYAQLAK